MYSLKKVLWVAFLVASLTIGLTANGLNLNGVGSKAIAMGGAFIGLADDYSAVYWNPAGLTQMKNPSISLFATSIIPTGTYKLEMMGMTIADAETQSTMYPSGAFGYFKPISEKMTIGILAYVPAGSGAKWDGDDLRLLSNGMSLKWESMLGMVSVSPVIAVKLSDKFSIGATLNINYALLKMKRPSDLGQYEEDLDGMGVGATLGMLFKPAKNFSIGLTFKTPVSAKISGTATIPGMAKLGFPTESQAEREATWSMFLGAGLAYKPTDKLTITADVQYTNWKSMTDIPMTFGEATWKALGLEAHSKFELRWKDTTQIRVGLEYKVSDCFALRVGYLNDPAPSPEGTLNILLPEITYNAYTFGFGYKTGNLIIDACFEIYRGTERFVDPTAPGYVDGSGMPGYHNNNMLVPNIAFTYVFGK